MLQGKPACSTARMRERRLLTTCAVGAALVAMTHAPKVRAQSQPPAFQGEATTVGGGATVTRGGPGGLNPQTGTPFTAIDTVNVTTPTAVINWSTFDPTGTGNIDFLPNGTAGVFRGNPGFTVLNRVLPSRAAAIGLNGAITSITNDPVAIGGNVWFYSPNGVIVGSGARITVGSLALTTADIPFTAGATGGITFGPGGTIGFGRGEIATVAGSSVIVNPGAQIRAGVDGGAAIQSNYVVLVAPRVEQRGLVNVNGSAAYVGAEAADITINNGLFDIAMTMGTTDPNGVVHGGISTGPATTSASDPQRIYMTTVAKNTAVTMLVGGNAGYTPAAEATDEGGAVVLSAGYDIDDGAIALSPSTAGTGANDLTIAQLITGGTSGFTSDVLGRASATLTVRPGTSRSTINFAQDATLTGDRALDLRADGRVLVGGSLALTSAGTATVQIDAPETGYGGPFGGLLDVNGTLTLDVSATGLDGTTAGGNATGGIATLGVAGLLDVDGATSIFADAQGGNGTSDAGDGQGGTARLSVLSIGRAELGSLTVSAAGRGGVNTLGNATGGTGEVLIGSGGSLTVDGLTTVEASGIASQVRPATGGPQGGNGTGGIARIVNTFGTVSLGAGSVPGSVLINADGLGGTADPSGVGGDGVGGIAQFQASGGASNLSDIRASAVSRGGDGGTFGRGDGINARAGVTIDGSGVLTISNSATLVAGASGFARIGQAVRGGQAGFIVSGNSTLSTNSLFIDASASGGLGGPAGAASNDASVIGGTVQVGASGGTLNIDSLDVNASATPGTSSNPADGGGLGGVITLFANSGGFAGAFTVNSFASLNAGADGSFSPGSSATGGSINLLAFDGALDLPDTTSLNAAANSGPSDSPGQLAGIARGGAVGIFTAGESARIDFNRLSIDVSAASQLLLALFVPEPGQDPGDGAPTFGGNVLVDLQGGLFTGTGLFADASATGGSAGPSATVASRFEAGDATGGRIEFSMSGGTATLDTLSLTADGLGGSSTSTSPTAPVSALAGDGRGGVVSFDTTGGTLNAGSITLSASGRGGDGRAAAFAGGVGSDGGTGRGGQVTAEIGENDGIASTITTDRIDLVADGRGGDGGASSGAFSATNGGQGIGGGSTLTLSGGTLTTPFATVRAGGTGGIGGQSFGGGDAGNGGFGDGGTAEARFSGFSGSDTIDALVVSANAVGGGGGLAGDEFGYGVVYGVGAGGDGGGAAGGSAFVSIETDVDLAALAISADSTGGAGGGGGRVGGRGGSALSADLGFLGGSAGLRVAGGTTTIGSSDNGVLAISSSGQGGFGGIGAVGSGGAGGDAGAGIVFIAIQGESVLDLVAAPDNRHRLIANAGGGAGGESGFTTASGANGANGGEAAGRAEAISINVFDGGLLTTPGEVLFTADSVGGAASAGSDGPTGGGDGGAGGRVRIGSRIAINLGANAAAQARNLDDPIAWRFNGASTGGAGGAGGSVFSESSGDGGDGGRGGDARGGDQNATNLLLSFGEGSRSDFGGIALNFTTTGGNGADAGMAGSGGAGGDGGDGGSAFGGGTTFSFAGSADIGFDAITLVSGLARGGDGGDGTDGATDGGDGGDGGEAFGGDLTLTLQNADLTTNTLNFASSATGGRGGNAGDGFGEGAAGGFGGDGGDATGGDLTFSAIDSSYDFDTIDLSSTSLGGDGGNAGAGTGIPGVPGSPGDPNATPPVPPVPDVPAVPPANGLAGFGGFGSGGQITIFNDSVTAGTRNLGALTAGGGGVGGIGGLEVDRECASGIRTTAGARVELTDNSSVAGGAITIDSLTVNTTGDGGFISVRDGFFFTGRNGTLTVPGSVNINVQGGEAVFDFFGTGSLDIQGDLRVEAGRGITISHADRPADALTSIVAGNIDLLSFPSSLSGFIAEGRVIQRAGSIVQARDELFISVSEGVEADDLRALNQLTVIGGDITVRNATVTGAVSAPSFGDGAPNGGLITFSAGGSEGGFINARNVMITGTVSATGTVEVEAGGDFVVVNGALVRSDNRISIASRDDIMIEAGAELRAAQNPLPEFGYGSSGDPLGSPALLRLRAGSLLSSLDTDNGPLASLIVNGLLAAPGRAIQLEGDAIQAGGATILSTSLFANVTNAPGIGTAGRDDDGQLVPDCVEGNICLGDLSQIRNRLIVGPANRVTIGATDVQVATIDITARDALTIGRTDTDSIFSASESLRLTSTLGDVTLNRASLDSDNTGIIASGSLLGSGILTSTGDIGISVGGSIVATAIDAGGELTQVEQIGGESEGFYSLAGDFIVGTLDVGGGFDLDAGGSIDIGTLGVSADALVDLEAGGSAFLGDAGAGGQPFSIAIDGAAVGFGNLFATDTITLTARSGGVAGGSLGAASVDLDAVTSLLITSISGDLDADTGDLAQFGSISGSNASIDAGSIFVDLFQVGSGNLTTGGLLTLNTATVGTLDATTGSFDIGTLNASGAVDITAGGSGAIDLATTGTEGSLVLAANGITLGSATAGQAINLTSTSFIDATTLGAGTSITIGAVGAVDIGTADAGTNILIDAGSLTVAAATMTAGNDVVVTTDTDADLGTTDAGGMLSVTAGGAIDFVSLTAGSRLSLSAGTDIDGGGAQADVIGFTAATGIDFTSLNATGPIGINAGTGIMGGTVATGDASISIVAGAQVTITSLATSSEGTGANGSNDVRITTSGGIGVGTIAAGDDAVLRADGAIIVDSATTGNNFVANTGGDITLGTIESLGLDDFGYGGSGYGDIADVDLSAGGAVSFSNLTAADSIVVNADGAVTGGPATADLDVTISGDSVTVGALRAGADGDPANVGVTATEGDLVITTADATRDVRLTAISASIGAGAITATGGVAALFASGEVSLTSVDAGQTLFVGNAAQLETLGTTPSAATLAGAIPQRIGGALTASGALVSRGGSSSGGGIRVGAVGGMTLADVTASGAAVYLTAGAASRTGAVGAGAPITGIFDQGLVATSLISTGGLVRLVSSAGGFDIGVGRSFGIFEVDALGAVEIDDVVATGFEVGYGGARISFDVDVATAGAIDVGTATAAGDVRLSSTASSVTAGPLIAQTGLVAVFAANNVALASVDSAQNIYVGNASQLSTLGTTPNIFQLVTATPVRIGGTLTATGNLIARGGPTTGGIRMASTGAMTLRDVTTGPANIFLSAGAASSAGAIAANFEIEGSFDNGLTATSVTSTAGGVRLLSTLGGFDLATGRSFRTFEVDALTAVSVDGIDVTGRETGYGGVENVFDIDIVTNGAIDLGAGNATGDIVLNGGVVDAASLDAGESIQIDAVGLVNLATADAGDFLTVRGSSIVYGDLSATDTISLAALAGGIRGGALTATSIGLDSSTFLDIGSVAGNLDAEAADLARFGSILGSTASIDAGSIFVDRLDVDTANLLTPGSLTLNTVTIDSLTVNAGSFDIGTLNSDGDVSITAVDSGALDFAAIGTAGSLFLEANGITLGRATAGQAIALVSTSFVDAGTLEAGTSITIDADGAVDLGTARAGSFIAIKAGSLTVASNTMTSGTDIAVSTVGDADLGVTEAGGSLSVDAGGAIDFTTLSAGGNLGLNSGAAITGTSATARFRIDVDAEGDIAIGAIDAGTFAGGDPAEGIKGTRLVSRGNIELGAISARDSIELEAAGAITVDSGQAGNIFLANAGGDVTLGTIETLGLDDFGYGGSGYGDIADVDLTAGGAVSFVSLTAADNIIVNADGAINGGLATADLDVTMRGDSVDVGAVGAGADGDAGTVFITATEASLDVASANATRDIRLSSFSSSVGAGALATDGGLVAIFASGDVSLTSVDASGLVFVGNSASLDGLGETPPESVLAASLPVRIGGALIATGGISSGNLDSRSAMSGIYAAAEGGIVVRDLTATNGSVLLSAGAASSAGTMSGDVLVQGVFDDGLTATSVTSAFGGVSLQSALAGFDIGAGRSLRTFEIDAETDVMIDSVDVTGRETGYGGGELVYDIEIDTNGAIALGTGNATGNILLDAQGAVGTGALTAGRDVDVEAGAGGIALGATVAGNQISLVSAGAASATTLRASADIGVNAAGATSFTTANAGDDVVLRGDTVTGETIDSAGFVFIDTVGAIDLDRITSTLDYVTLRSGSDVGVTTISAGYDIDIEADGDIAVGTATTTGAGRDPETETANIDFLAGGSLALGRGDSAENIVLLASGETTGGSLLANRNVTLTGASIGFTGDVVAGDDGAPADVLLIAGSSGLDLFGARATRDVLFTSLGLARFGTVRAVRAFVGTGGSLLAEDAEAARIRLTATSGTSSLGRVRSGSTIELISSGEVTRFADVLATGDIEIDTNAGVAFGTVTSTNGEFDIAAAGDVTGDLVSAGAEFTISTTNGGVNVESARAGLVAAPITADNRRSIGIRGLGDVRLGFGEAAIDIGLASGRDSVIGGTLNAVGGTLAIFAGNNVQLANATARDQIFVGNSSQLAVLGQNYEPSALRALEPVRVGGRMSATGDLRVQGSPAGSSIAIGAAGGIALRDAMSTLGGIRLTAGGASTARALDADGSISGLLDGGLTATSLFARQGGVTLAASNGGYDIGSIDSRFRIAVVGSGLVDIDSAITRGATGSTSPAGILLRSTGSGVTIGTASSTQNLELTAQGAIAAGNLAAGGLIGMTGGALAFGNATAGGFVEGRAASIRGGNITAASDTVLVASSGVLQVGDVIAGDDIVIAATGAGTGATIAAGALRSTGAGSDTATGPITFQGATGPNGTPIAGAGPVGAIIRVTGTGAVTTGNATTPGRLVIASQQDTITSGTLSANGGIATLGGGSISLGSVTTTGVFVAEGSAAATLIADTNDPAALLTQPLASLPGALSAGTIQAGQILVATNGAITLGNATATGTVTLNAANGAVGVSDLRAGGAVDARGTALAIGSNGGALTFSNALASAGAIDIDIAGALTVTNTTATGAIALESDTDVSLVTATGGAGIEIDAGRNATLSGAVTATGLLDVAATRLAAIDGASNGANILIASGDIAIGANGRLGTASTQLLRLSDTDAERATFIGGAGSTMGYSLSAEEMLRLQANSITISGGRVEAQNRGQVGSGRAPDVIVGAFTLGARNGNTTGQIGQSGTLRIETPGKLRVTGAAALTSMASGNRFEISALEALEIDALAGSIDLRASGGALGGTLFLQSEDVIAASLAAIGDVGRATTTDAIDDRLATNDGPVNDDGVLRANGIEVTATRGVFVQNSGAGDRFRERRGLTVGSGGLRINTGSRDTTGSTTTRIVINGRQVQDATAIGSSGFVTGVDFLRLVSINGATGGMQSGLDSLSTINGCGIANPGACFAFDVTPPLTDDIINRPLDPVGDFDESALTGSDLPTTLIELRDFEPFGFEPLIDEPVTGAGNDDLYISDCEPGSDEADCEVPPEGARAGG